MIRPLVGRLLHRFGYSLKRVSEGWLPGRTYWTAAYLRRLGFAPKTLIDIGVAYGSPTGENHALYEAFPDAHLVLFEPLREFDSNVKDILAKHPGIHIPSAVGNRIGTEKIRIETPWIERSSLLRRTALEASERILEEREVPLTTLDAALDAHRLQGPFGIKIDAEGYEVAIIKGGSKVLRKTEFVIAEVAVASRFSNGYSFAGFIALMDRHGFALCDLLDIGRAVNSEVTFIDCVFKRKSPK
ncbi:MAG: FkbM family methyltransferase [Pseudomonadota bacterium]